MMWASSRMPTYKFEVSVVADTFGDALDVFPPGFRFPGGVPEVDSFLLLETSKHRAEFAKMLDKILNEKEN